MSLSQRTFGVEIEHGNPTYTCTRVGTLVKEHFKGWGKVVNDGSGIEVISPVLCGAKGLDEVKAVMGYLESIGGRMGDDDGFHVHHGAEEFLDKEGEERTIRLVQSWAANQTVINRCLPERRCDDRVIHNRDNGMSASCYKPLWPDRVKEVVDILKTEGDEWGAIGTIKSKAARTDRFYAINVNALHKHGTIEIRQHHGTFDFQRCAAWIRFGQSFIETSLSMKKSIGAHRTFGGLCDTIGLSDKDKTILRKKESV